MRKILVVEDEPTLRDAYEMILSTEPYIINVAENGEEALQLCKSTDYDLILLDIMMPKVDGVMFLQRFPQLKRPQPKIIIMSNLSAGEEVAQALELGAVKNILKANLSPKQLLSLVRYELQAN